ncbi:14827_t:CDS:1 [Funneliformis caledonium]|uniref:14827_t:CDS:1 n=1 Tax=Funneliformis caledonium TaxID=1117310 RepID=A0A9N8Z3K2_9GLOM|nr:14827_t:CDS:1 [Funneliformis caledonium]
MFCKKAGIYIPNQVEVKKQIRCEKYHVIDTSKQLEIIGRWLVRIAKLSEDKFKNTTLTVIAPSIFQILKGICLTKCTSECVTSESTFEESSDISSLFMLHVSMQLKQIIITQKDLEIQFYRN